MKIETSQVDDYVRSGLRNLWYAVLPSWKLGQAPLGITRLGENIVLWRDGDGSVHAMEDRCPHRRARLSLGWNLGDRLACWYHGVETDHTGTVVRVPAVEKCSMEGEKCLRTYVCKEAAGAIFVYFGDARHPEPPALELPEQIDAPEWGTMLCQANWRCNYRLAIDNVMDPMHGAYLHADSHSMSEGNKRADMRIRPTPTGFVFEKANQQGVNFDWVEWGETGAHWLRLAIPYRKKYGPGGPFYVIVFCTPVDDMQTVLMVWRCRKVQGWQRDVWKLFYRNRLEGLHWAVLEQDRQVLETLAPESAGREHLYQHDAGLAHVRRAMRERARRELQ